MAMACETPRTLGLNRRVCAGRIDDYNEQEISNVILSFGKLEHVDMDLLKVRLSPSRVLASLLTISACCPGGASVLLRQMRLRMHCG